MGYFALLVTVGRGGWRIHQDVSVTIGLDSVRQASQIGISD
jgi:hypothetical protein